VGVNIDRRPEKSEKRKEEREKRKEKSEKRVEFLNVDFRFQSLE
jgi:hypothetical protein